MEIDAGDAYESGLNYATLVDHMAIAALRMRQLPAKRLSGEIFTSLHIDLNSVILDRKYLNAGFYVNSLEVDGLGDSYNAELVELPRLVNPDVPEQGVLLYSSQTSFDLFEADGGFVRVENNNAYFCDYRGTVRKQLTLPQTYAGFITVREEAFYMLTKISTVSVVGTSNYYWLTRPEVKTTYTRTGGTSHGQVMVNMYGEFRRAVVTKNQIAIGTDRAFYLYDSRYHTGANVMKVKDYTNVFAVSDDFFVADESLIVNVFFIYGDLYIVREQGIYKYCP